MRTCIFDPRMGVSGDMVVAAMIDCGADGKNVVGAMETAGNVLGETKVHISKVQKQGVAATSIEVITELVSHRKSLEMREALEKALALTKVKNKDFARKCLNTLLQAESHVHSCLIDDLILHETGSPDTLCDIVGATLACESLGLFECMVLSTPIATGYGFIKTHHGVMPIPAPATAEILKGCLIESGTVEGELTTPTGAAILKTLLHNQVTHIPPMKLEGAGYGAGKKDFALPNVLRVLFGEEEGHREEVVMLETNLDDVTGEIMGNAVTHLDCLDFAIIPTTTKKNRPGYILQVICEKGKEALVAEEIFKRTGSLGVRSMPVDRFVFEREIQKARVNGEEVGIKTSRRGKEVVRRKPEFEDIVKLAQKKGISLFEAERMVMRNEKD